MFAFHHSPPRRGEASTIHHAVTLPKRCRTRKHNTDRKHIPLPLNLYYCDRASFSLTHHGHTSHLITRLKFPSKTTNPQNGLLLAIRPLRQLLCCLIREDALPAKQQDQPLFDPDRIVPVKTTPFQSPLDSLLGVCLHPHCSHPCHCHRLASMGSWRVHCRGWRAGGYCWR